MYVYMYIYICICMYLCMYLCMYVYSVCVFFGYMVASFHAQVTSIMSI